MWYSVPSIDAHAEERRSRSMQVPAELRYSKDHEWIRIEDDRGTVGITDFAQDALGDVVFVELPAVGTTLEAGQTFGVVESNKTVSDLFAPVGGEVIEVNDELRSRPELVNQEPYGAGWMIRLATTKAAAASLLDATAYRAHVEQQQA
jgi:glycine cleavage system H protein